MILIADCKNWDKKFQASLQKALTETKIIHIKQKEELTLATLKKFDPEYIFFPHWSYIIPEEIFTQFECVIFHMTDVPFGRGGSPLQNLISRGIYETKMTALRCNKDLDAGPVYLKKPFSLYGSAEEIYYRASILIQAMIIEIMQNKIKPVPQTGEPTVFKRRTKEEGNISVLTDLNVIFDHIRMLDAEGYPKAFLDFGEFRLEFSRASFKKNKIIADVEIRKKDE